MGSADDELAGGVDEILGILGQQILRQHPLDDLLDAEFLDLRVLHIRRVLGGNDDVDDAGRLAIDVFDGDLGLRVGAEPFHLARLADAGQLAAKPVREHDRRGHQLGSFIAGVTEHDALVARTLFGVFFTGRFLGIHALGDVR